MNRIRMTLTALAAALFLAPAAAAQSYCDNQTTGLLLSLPNYNQAWYQWGTCARNSLWTLNNSSASLSGSTVTASRFGPIYTPEIGGRDTGTPGIKVSSPIYTLSGGPYFIFRTSGSVEGAGGFGVTYGLTAGSVTVTNGLTASSVTAAGAGGVLATYGVVAATGVFSGGVTASSGNITGPAGLTVAYGVSGSTAVFSGGVTASSGNITGPAGLAVAYGVVAGTVTASSGVFNGAGGTTNPYVLRTSTGIRIDAGYLDLGPTSGIRWPGGTISTAPASGGGGGSGTTAVVKSTICVTNSLVTASTVIPRDDTIPQNTEGDEVLTCPFTPTSASNRLRVTAVGWFCTPSTGYKSGAIFRDSEANAKKAADIGGYPADNCDNFTIVMEESAVAASATTYKLRIGPSSALNIYVNGIGAARLFGGVGGTSIQIDEIVP